MALGEAALTACYEVSGGRRLVGAMVLVVGLWWLFTPGAVVGVTKRVELPEEWAVVVTEVDWVKEKLDDEPFTTLRPALVRIPAGTFRMGSPQEALAWKGDRQAFRNELAQRDLTILAFQMCKTEVTQAQYESVMGTVPSICGFGCDDDLPVQNVTWYNAVAYLNRLTELESEARVGEGQAPLSTCYWGDGVDVLWVTDCTGYRLPTEAEWEYAARAGTDTSWSFGDYPAILRDYAWHDGNAGYKVHEVGTKKANPWGLNDVHGNVWEWVWDAYDSYKSGKVVNSDGTQRTLRGGSFVNSPGLLRSANRIKASPINLSGYHGFRCARGPGPQR